ncbi:DUF928 domain-containing protein [Nostoc sp. CHAB 5844]|nr:DUF928 domain-containing protein [Nostoc sp. CHAB 5844]
MQLINNIKCLIGILTITFLLPNRVITAQIQPATFKQNISIPIVSPGLPIKYQGANYGKANRRISVKLDLAHCLSDARNYGNKYLTALVPKYDSILTTSENPTFFFYLPRTSKTYVQAFDLTLEDVNKNVVYQETFQVNNKPGVFQVSLRDRLNKFFLKKEQNYNWFFSAICDYSDRSRDLVLTGTLKRVTLEQNLTTELKKASLRERAAILAASGIWDDSLNILAKLRLKNRKDAGLKTDWQTLLESVELAQVAQEPIVGELKAQ